jgi:anti-anti-sigma factor
VKPQPGDVTTSHLLDGTRLFSLSGEFDMSNAWKIKDVIAPAVREGRDVIVDLTEVNFFDSRVVRVLVKARLAAIGRGLAFRVVPPANHGDLWRLAEAGEMRLAA